MSRGTLGRPLLKRDIELAKSHSRSASEAARYLNVSYKTYRKYAVMYNMWETNQAGKGIPRPHMKGSNSLSEIFEGKHPHTNINRLKERMQRAGLLGNECELCGYKEVRPNGKGPFTLYFKDGNRKNFVRENLELRCYNCVYLTTGYVDPIFLKMGAGIYNQDFEEQTKGMNIDIDKLQEEARQEMSHSND